VIAQESAWGDSSSRHFIFGSAESQLLSATNPANNLFAFLIFAKVRAGMKKLLLALIAFYAVWWIFFRDAPAPAAGVRANAIPEQTTTDAPAWTKGDYEIQPLARYHITARVLGKKRYRFDNVSDLAPVDLALGWRGMSDSAALEHFSITQSARWYEYLYDAGCPLSAGEIVAESANVHCLPADEDVASTLKGVRRNAFVELKGFLVEVRHEGRPPWRSSLVRNDSGNGSCEIFWIEDADEIPAPQLK
jgi:hypothetical protein